MGILSLADAGMIQPLKLYTRRAPSHPMRAPCVTCPLISPRSLPHTAGTGISRSRQTGTYAATTMRVVVTGSSGPIGNALCSHLAGSGHHVVRVVRRPVRPGEATLSWDPEVGTIDARGLEGADAVVHL